MQENAPTAKNTLTNTAITASGNVHIGDILTYVMAGESVALPRHLTLNIPLSAGDIIGREQELDDTYRLLHSGKPTVLVNGVGGMGKTATATKYIARYGHEYRHLAWLTVSGTLPDAFIGNAPLLQAFKDLQLEASVQSHLAMKNPDAAFQLVLKALNDLGENAKTLVVLDNANQLPDLVANKKYFDTARCHFLLTSRTRPPAWQIVSIERLPDPHALALFRRHYPTARADDAALLPLLARLDFHTLLLELVAKSAAASGILFDTLQAIVRDKFIHDPALNKRPVETGPYGDNLQDRAKRAKVEEYIWLIFENVTQLHDGEKALLRAFALLPTATAFDEAFLEDFAKHFDLEAHLPERLDRLVERGWLDSAQELGQAPMYKIHPLIAEVAVKHLAVDAGYAEPYIAHVAGLINYNSLDPKHNLFEKRTKQYLAERLKDLFFDADHEKVSYLLDGLRRLEAQFGFYKKAASYGDRALAIDLKNFGPDHPTVAVSQSNLANVYGDLGRYERAAELLETALNSAEKNFGPDHPTVAVRQSNLANVYWSLGRYERAAELLETALNSDLKNFGPDHPNVAVSQSNLAIVYRNLGRYERAAELLETALASAEKNFGPDHPTVAVRQSNLANVYGDLGRYERAAELLETALASDLKNFGPDYPTVAVSQSNLAAIHLRTGKKAEAKVLLQAALQNFLKSLGPEHPHTLGVQNWLSQTT